MSEKKDKMSSADKRFSKEAEPERAKTRQKYEEMSKKLQSLDVRHVELDETYEVIDAVMSAANEEIVKSHVTPREMKMDAELVKNAAKKYSDILDGLEADAARAAPGRGRKFVMEEFAIKLINLMSENSKDRFGEDDGVEVNRDDWVAFARTASAAFSSPMTLDGRPLYLQVLGPAIEESGPPEAVAASPRRKSQVVTSTKEQQKSAPPPKATRLLELRPRNEKDDTDKNMQKRIEHCLSIIKKAIRDGGYHPVHYLELVTDPESYENTVRNMFTVSFLLNRSEVGLVFDGDEQPYLYVLKDKHKLKDRDDHPKLNVKEDLEEESAGNWIVSVTPDEWKDIIELYDIKEAMLPAPETLE